MAVIEAIATTYLEADAASVTFSSLGSYEHLQLRMSVRTDRFDHDMVRINFNSDTGANYSRHYMRGYASSTQAGADTAQNYSRGGWIPGADMDAADYGTTIVDILDYKDDGNKNTTLNWLVGAATDGNVYLVSGLWDNTDDVTSIVLVPHNGSNFVRGSEFTLYGIQE